MNNSQYVYICIGIMMGFVFTTVVNSLQPRNITHEVHLTIEKPLEAKLDLSPVMEKME